MNAVYFLNQEVGWIGGDRLFRTIDGGQNWQFTNNAAVKSMVFLDQNAGFLVGDADRTLYNTTTSGEVWVKVAGIESFIDKVWFIDKTHGWAAGDFVYRTTDGGSTWTRGTPQIGFGDGRFIVYDLNFTDLNHGWVIAGRPSLSGRLYITNDGGRTFKQALFSGAGNVLRSVYFHPDSSGWAVTDKGSFVQTADGGKNGVRQGDRKFQPLTKVNFIGDFGYAFGASGNSGASLGFYIYRPAN